MPRIHILDPGVVAKIRAGEVIDRPAAVVKELLENSLDAGSRLVAIHTASSPDRMIRVQDDGSGMKREDALLAVKRHATSKLTNPEDLETIETLGFRGEALASVAEVSRLTLSTRAADELTGTQVEILGGTVISVTGVGRAAGTTVAVEDLFYNTPARQRFLKSREAESRAVARIVWSYALITPEVHWRFKVEGREDTELPASADLLERWQVLYGRGSGEGAACFGEEVHGIRVHGVLGAPEMARATREHQVFAVNGRVVSSPALTAAVRQGYGNLIPGDRHPVALLLIGIDPGQVDVNVHPTKREVRFRDESGLFQAVRRSVEIAMRRYVPVSLSPGFFAGEAAVLDPEGGAVSADLMAGAPGTMDPSAADAGGSASGPGTPRAVWSGGSRPPGPPGTPGWDGIEAAHLFYAPADTVMATAPGREAVTSGDVRQSLTEHEIPIWQLHDRYLLAPIRGGLVIVDQHAAHERILYEEARAQLFGEAGASQVLLFPRVLDLTPAELETLLGAEPMIRRLGYEIGLFGERQVAVRGVPAALTEETAIDALKRLLAREDPHGEPLEGEAPEERIAKSYACHAAVRSGQSLSPIERRALFDRLFATSLPHGDPHGRATYVRVSMEELDRRFGRR
ncbi:MAG TPA: DNA mismatch repair endonuclease MutL [Candidatus Eisenbacteria bacterium]|nr:DNA mismatch repair endonuclease MutL [Candidatus Eisenbacteria bacterium]